MTLLSACQPLRGGRVSSVEGHGRGGCKQVERGAAGRVPELGGDHPLVESLTCVPERSFGRLRLARICDIADALNITITERAERGNPSAA